MKESGHRILKTPFTPTDQRKALEVLNLFHVTGNAGEAGRNDDAPRGIGQGGSFLLSLIIGIVLFGISFYVWYLVKQRQVVTEQLDILRAELKNLFDDAPCGYHAVDDHGYFVSANRTLLSWLGYEKEELIGKIRFTDVVDEKDRPMVENISSATGSGHLDIGLKKKGGGTLPVVLSMVSRTREVGADEKVLYSTIDNSQCKEAIDRMRNLDQELEAFSYSISHDLRAPLRSIDGYSKILQEDYAAKLDEEGRRVLNVIMNNAKRMGKLIDDLLEFGRLGRKNLQKSRLNLTNMVNGIVQELLSQERGRKSDIHIGELYPAYADPDMMRQVWFHLLENAIKFTGKKETATIRVRSFRTEEGDMVYEVSDNGDGFDMKYVGKLFGVFQRLHKIQDFPGTGVGLAIVKRIISRHGGRVWAEGSVHAGATFYFTIPTQDENS